jgi:hypothetical protein
VNRLESRISQGSDVRCPKVVCAALQFVGQATIFCGYVSNASPSEVILHTFCEKFVEATRDEFLAMFGISDYAIEAFHLDIIAIARDGSPS